MISKHAKCLIKNMYLLNLLMTYIVCIIAVLVACYHIHFEEFDCLMWYVTSTLYQAFEMLWFLKLEKWLKLIETFFLSRFEYLFNFDNTFEIHDDIEVLKRMGMACGLESGSCSAEDLKIARSLVPKALEPYVTG